MSKAQNPVIDIENRNGNRQTNAYYKDTNNLLNQYVGTYVYNYGNVSFKIVLEKRIQQYNGDFYEDIIIGEYQYIENNIELSNTIPEINTVYNNQIKHNIYGYSLINNNNREWLCSSCNLNNKRLRGVIKDVSTSIGANIFLHRTVENNQEVLKVKISNVDRIIVVSGQSAPSEFSLPVGEFTMIKQ